MPVEGTVLPPVALSTLAPTVALPVAVSTRSPKFKRPAEGFGLLPFPEVFLPPSAFSSEEVESMAGGAGGRSARLSELYAATIKAPCSTPSLSSALF